MKSNMMPLVSIVVPVYNVESYLARCLDSIVAQSYENLEILLIDDGSTDTSPNIADSYLNKDSRFKVIHKKNGGLSDARNVGIGLASGEYITFVDSDDYVHINFVEKLMAALTENGTDIAACAYKRVLESDNSVKTVNDRNNVGSIIFDSRTALIDVFSASSKLNIVTWNKLYRTSLFRDANIEFPVGRIHEDNYTTYKLVFEASKTIYIDQVLYFYTYREESIMGGGFSERSFDKFKAVEEAIYWSRSRGLVIEDNLSAYKLSVGLDVVNSIVDSKKSDKITLKHWSKARSFTLSLGRDVFFNDKISIKQKIAFLFLIMGKPAYTILRQIYTSNGTYRSKLIASQDGARYE